MCIYICNCTHICTHIIIHIHIYIHIHTHKYPHTYTHIYTLHTYILLGPPEVRSTKYDGTDDIFIKIHLDSVPESIVTGRHPPTLQVPDRSPRGRPAARETGPNWVSTPYVSRPPSGVIIPGRNPERRPTPAGPPPRPNGAAPRGGATRFPLSDPVLNGVLNGYSVMEHLSVFQITDEELDLSRRVIEGELNLEAAVDQLREMFQRMPSSRRPPGGPPGGLPQ